MAEPEAELIARLRFYHPGYSEHSVYEQSARAMERLVAERDRLRAALEAIASEMHSYMQARGWSDDPFPALKQARAALAASPKPEEQE